MRAASKFKEIREEIVVFAAFHFSIAFFFPRFTFLFGHSSLRGAQVRVPVSSSYDRAAFFRAQKNVKNLRLMRFITILRRIVANYFEEKDELLTNVITVVLYLQF